MHGVGPGSVLGARYAVTLRTAEGPRHERWRANDLTLEREVVLVCFPSDAPVAAATMDAARRAAGIEDPRLVRVLDVGSDGPVSYVVEEPLTGALNLSQLVQGGGLPPEEVRRIVGESASALDRARHRGLHHLVLSPQSVLRMPDGDIKVRGLATEAALGGADRASEGHALRVDAVGLVRIAYAGLTSRWPVAVGGSGLQPAQVGLEPAPSVVGGFAAPSEIAVGVPNDLDLICRMTLNEGRGPISPRDLATQIAPWPSEQPVRDGATGIGLPPSAHALQQTSPYAAGPAAAGPVPGGAPAGGYQPTAPLPPTGRHAAPATGLPGGVPTGVAGSAAGLAGGASVGGGVGGGVGGVAAGGAAVASGAGQSAPSGVGPPPAGVGAPGPHPGAGVPPAAQRSSSDLFDRLSDARTGHPGQAHAQRATSYAQAAADRASRGGYEAQDIALADALDSAPTGRLEPPVPGLGRGQAGPEGSQSRIALAIVGVLVVLALIVGIQNVARIGDSDDPTPAQTKVTVTATRTPSQTATDTPSSPTDTSSTTTSTDGTLPPGATIAIVGGKGFDPEDDNTESDKLVPLSYDGNPTTYWKSRWYGSDSYNGGKSGVGLVLDLAAPSAITEVTVDLRAPQTVAVFAANADSLDGAQQIGATVRDQSGVVTFRADATTAPFSKIIVWVTKAAPDEAPDHYRAQVSEVTVR